MLAGLLKQPRSRGEGAMMAIDPGDDPRLLKKKIAELESKLALTEDLVRVLRDLPWNRDRKPKTSTKRPASSKRKGANKRPGEKGPVSPERKASPTDPESMDRPAGQSTPR
jgi:hypothetical protein